MQFDVVGKKVLIKIVAAKIFVADSCDECDNCLKQLTTFIEFVLFTNKKAEEPVQTKFNKRTKERPKWTLVRGDLTVHFVFVCSPSELKEILVSDEVQ